MSDITPERLSEKELCPEDLLRGQEEAFARDIVRLQKRSAEFVAVDCPACGRNDSSNAFTKHSFQYLSCQRCHTIYMSPRPSPEVMGDYYSNSENYKYWADYIFPASQDHRREKINKPWLKRIESYCERFSFDSSTLLEIGPGFGTFAKLAKDSGRFNKVVVIEPTPEMAQSCRAQGLDVIEKRIEDIEPGSCTANVAVAFEVIEHLFFPRHFVMNCRNMLLPGGLLVVSCPNGLGFDIATLRERSLAVDPEHVNLFNPESLSLLLEECGFEVLEAGTPGRLDAEFVRTAILSGEFDISDQPFLKRVLVDEWDKLGWAFQTFLAENGLSSHMWIVARRKESPLPDSHS